mmetsp:Transcript_5508/g.15564  ORF Transcript_5508/g.15564 Transcript_5508/m.15564 type:complete len:318 (-) Transcript_5508:106-1059(-)
MGGRKGVHDVPELKRIEVLRIRAHPVALLVFRRLRRRGSARQLVLLARLGALGVLLHLPDRRRLRRPGLRVLEHLRDGPRGILQRNRLLLLAQDAAVPVLLVVIGLDRMTALLREVHVVRALFHDVPRNPLGACRALLVRLRAAVQLGGVHLLVKGGLHAEELLVGRELVPGPTTAPTPTTAAPTTAASAILQAAERRRLQRLPIVPDGRCPRHQVPSLHTRLATYGPVGHEAALLPGRCVVVRAAYVYRHESRELRRAHQQVLRGQNMHVLETFLLLLPSHLQRHGQPVGARVHRVQQPHIHHPRRGTYLHHPPHQ